MLRLILDRSPEVAIPTESMTLVDFEPIRRGARDLGNQQQAVAFLRQVWGHPRIRLWGLTDPPPVPPLGLSHLDAFRFCIEAPYRTYAAQHGKKRWADKTPPYVFHTKSIRAVWGDARILEIVRDGRDVALSIQPLPFGANNVYAAGRDWAAGIRAGSAAKGAIGADFYTVRYEDLVAGPEETVKEICEFLEISFIPSMLSIEETDQAKIIAHEASWFTNVWAGINQKSVAKWKREMTKKDQGLFAGVAGHELRHHGYDPGVGEVQPSSLVATRMATFDAALRVRNFVRLRIIEERRRALDGIKPT